MSRDPIEESGSLNLYTSMLNDPINNIDLLGLKDSVPKGCKVRILIHTTSIAKSDENTFEAAAIMLRNEYKQEKNTEISKIILKKVGTGKEIVSILNNQEEDSIQSLDLFSHSNLAGIHISRKLGTPVKSPWHKRKLHDIIRNDQDSNDAEFMEESYHGLYSDASTATGVGIYYNQKSGNGIAYLKEIDFKNFASDSKIEFHGCKTAQEIRVGGYLVIENFAINFSNRLQKAGKDNAMVIGHVFRSSPDSRNDYRRGKRRVYQGGTCVK